MIHFLTALFLVLVAIVPVAVFADGFPPQPLVPCGGGDQPPCDFNQLIHLLEHVISFALFLAAPIAALMFAYAGWLYLSDTGNEENVKKAHNIFWTVLLGIIFALGAWLFVKFVTDALLREGFTLLGD